MIIATQKCGCPTPLTIKNPECTACCNPPSRKVSVKLPNPDIPTPTGPSLNEKHNGGGPEAGNKVPSDITAKGLPYKEVEAIINDNRLIMRIQDEPIKEQYDPPCDCVRQDNGKDTWPDSPSPREENPRDTRTVVLYPRPHRSNLANPFNLGASDGDKKHKREQAEKVSSVKLIEQEENPNVFLLRIKRNSSGGERKQDLDVEFKIPRPWSRRKRTEWEAMKESVGSRVVLPEESSAAVRQPARKKRGK